jgi:hypothetical protein
MPGTEQPQITVEIRGANACGKTVVAQLLFRALRAEQITVIAPPNIEWLPKDPLRQAIADLKARGLSVELIETKTPGPIRPKRQVDARYRKAELVPA